MNIELDLQVATAETDLPSLEQLYLWVNATLGQTHWATATEVELTIRVVDSTESQQLNNQYRHKNKPTNVLSFPSDLPSELELPLLGDLVICAPVVVLEANQQRKSLLAHWAHMVVHGTLHLTGYDHVLEEEAEIMERLETQIVVDLGYPPPYDAHFDHQ